MSALDFTAAQSRAYDAALTASTAGVQAEWEDARQRAVRSFNGDDLIEIIDADLIAALAVAGNDAAIGLGIVAAARAYFDRIADREIFGHPIKRVAA